MDRVEKQLQKIPQKDRERLEKALSALIEKEELGRLDMKKLRGDKMYRVRSGKYRIICSFEVGEVIIHDIRRRDDKTYSDL